MQHRILGLLRRFLPVILILGLVLLLGGWRLLLVIGSSAVSILLMVALGIGLVLGLGFGWDWLRRRRADRSGFQTFISQGARHSHPLLIRALSEGLELEGAIYRPRPIGPLTLGSGQIIAADPGLLMERADQGQEPPPPFAVTFGQGSHPVIMLQALQPDSRVAALAVRFSRDPVAWLEPAWRPGDTALARRQRSLPLIPVDSAQLTLGASEAVAAWMRATLRPELGAGAEDGTTNPYTSGNPAHLWARAETQAGPVYTVLAGFGDGAYPAWIARSAKGLPVWLILDFELLGEAEPMLPRSGSRPEPVPSTASKD